MTKKVYVVAAKRTAIGSFMGTLKNVHPALFGAEVVKNILAETALDGGEIDEVIVGNILPAGLGQGVARQVAIHAGIPHHVPAYAVNMVCGSGMKSVMNAFTSIQAGLHHLIIAGGTESMSKAPYILPDKIRPGIKMGGFAVKDHMIDDALMDAFNPIHMGITAENIVEKYGITREAQDRFAIESQARAIAALDRKRFVDEIVPIEVKERKSSVVFDTDEYPNRTTSFEKLNSLRPAFKKDGSVTAGNASGINDGASFMLIASEEAIEKYNLTPLAEVVGIGQGGVDPNYMGLGPTPAIDNALNHAGVQLKDIDLLELNEAFAAQSLGVLHELEEKYQIAKEQLQEKTNVNGGAIALGHPVGASGNRIIVTLVHEMIKRDSTYGLASLCIGGGMGTAMILRRV